MNKASQWRIALAERICQPSQQKRYTYSRQFWEQRPDELSTFPHDHA